MKSTATCTVWLEDGTENKHANVTYSRWSRDDRSFVVQRYDPNDENRLQTFVYKREHVKQTVREHEYTEETDLTEKPKERPGLDDPKPQSIKIDDNALESRFYIVHGEKPDLAWSGSRWVPHIGGFATSGEKIWNLENRKAAEAYAKVVFPGATIK